MADIDLDKLSLEELKKLQKAVNKAVEDYDTRKRQEAAKALEAKAKEMGFSLAELTGTPAKKTASPPKYRHPDDPSKTWTGRGRQPAWIKDAVESGQSADDFLIEKSG